MEIRELHAERVLAELVIGAPSDNGWVSVVRVCVHRVCDGELAASEAFTKRDRAYDRAHTSSRAAPAM